jgi:hypothetical protein
LSRHQLTPPEFFHLNSHSNLPTNDQPTTANGHQYLLISLGTPQLKKINQITNSHQQETTASSPCGRLSTPTPITMANATATRNVANEDKTWNSPAAKVQPKQQITCSSSRSSKTSNVNSLLTKINLPKFQFNGILTALGRSGGGDDGLNTPCNLVPPRKAMHPQVNHPVSSTSIEASLDELVPQENATPCNNPTFESTIRINKNPASNPPSNTQAESATNQMPGSILWHAPAAPLA